MPFSYANPTSGPSAGGIGWFNFENLTMNPGDTVTGLTGTLNDGSIVTFDMSLSSVSGTPRQFNAVTVPTYLFAQFGSAGYTGIAGNVAMYAALSVGNVAVSQVTLSNITVTTSGGDPIPNYSVLIADAETTNLFEGIRGQTNGTDWNLFTVVGTGGNPTLTGLGTQTFDITGISQFGQMVAYVLSTQGPSQLLLTLTDNDPVETRQGFSIGFAITRLRLQKDVADRIDSADQFELNIAGTPSANVTTMGSSTGLQSEFANVYATPGNIYTINESMAPGSVSSLTDYLQTVSVGNATPAGSIPPAGNFPIDFAPALGDDVIYTVLNSSPQTFVKSVDKAFADVGEVLTYTVTVDNPNDFAVNDVFVTDTTPSGTTYIGNLTISAPHTGTDLSSGITITTISSNASVTITWQVQVNSIPPVPNPITNYASVTVPGGTSGITNIVTTQVSSAYVSVMKMVDKPYAKPGDVLTYTLTLNNAGNTPANNVSLADTVPAGTTLVPGSIIGATGNLPVLTLADPISPADSAVITFKVTVNDIPPVNPIPNFSYLNYSYTVKPDEPDAKTVRRRSNTVTTLISIATLSVIKAVDRSTSYLGDVINYKLAITNTGNVPADNVVLKDITTSGINFVPGTLTADVPVTGTPAAIQLLNPILPGKTVNISFQTKVTAMPNPNPVINQATADFNYTLTPQDPDGEDGSVASNRVCTLVFRYNYSRQITDIIESVALQQAALAALANAEGLKIQKMSSMGMVSMQELLSLNKSVASMLDSISTLESILKQKIMILDCQITGCS